MSDIRKANFIFLLKKQGKKKSNKVEIFSSELWKDGQRNHGIKTGRYRIRVNGKWFKNKNIKYFCKTEIRDLMWRSINF